MKRFVLFLSAACVSVFLATAQQREMSVEESYLQEEVQGSIIREQSRGISRENKEDVLDLIRDSLKEGTKSDQMREALVYMSMEGILNQTREGNRVLNNFPDIRRRSAEYLGQMATPEARDALLNVIYYETEVMVLQEAVYSLAKIGLEDNGNTVRRISWILRKYNDTNPDNLLALAAIEAYEKLGGFKDREAVELLMNIADNYKYTTSVRDAAKQAVRAALRSQTKS
ncbi:MAG: HEAT repeat domain-containing protein [Treponema sp.]|jgi:HEAT repeat protein|nr:HEAT repeat domain-containing protein [Treponema sp.]